MDTAQWPQEIVVKPIEEIVTNTCPKPSALERSARPQKEQALNCPRCNSTNTKFCYYNNYRITQPRYFCKNCRRYWTEGGSLRNIPVGGGSRKNKRSSSSSSKKLPDLVTPPSLHQNPNKIHDHHGQDLNLAFQAAASTTQGFRSTSEFVQLPNIESNNSNKNQILTSSSTTTNTTTSQQQLSALELLTGISSRGLNSFMPMQVPDPRFPMQDFKPTLNFSLDGLGSGYGSLQQSVQENINGRLLFPFEDLKQVSSTNGHHMEQNRGEHGDSSAYWTGMLGGGSW